VFLAENKLKELHSVALSKECVRKTRCADSVAYLLSDEMLSS